MRPEELRASIERKRLHDRLMAGPNNCGEAIAQWNPEWVRCPVCFAYESENGFIHHKDPAEVIQ
jgi:hypothetical protein